MREIKFKFVVKEAGEITVTESYFLGELMDYVNVLSEYSADEILYEFQYTGLKDKNDVEIYEGDIVAERKNRFDDGKSEYWVIEYDESTASYIVDNQINSERTIFWSNNTQTFVFDPYDGEIELEVIGNIYENKDILES